MFWLKLAITVCIVLVVLLWLFCWWASHDEKKEAKRLADHPYEKLNKLVDDSPSHMPFHYASPPHQRERHREPNVLRDEIARFLVTYRSVKGFEDGKRSLAQVLWNNYTAVEHTLSDYAVKNKFIEVCVQLRQELEKIKKAQARQAEAQLAATLAQLKEDK